MKPSHNYSPTDSVTSTDWRHSKVNHRCGRHNWVFSVLHPFFACFLAGRNVIFLVFQRKNWKKNFFLKNQFFYLIFIFIFKFLTFLRSTWHPYCPESKFFKFWALDGLAEHKMLQKPISPYIWHVRCPTTPNFMENLKMTMRKSENHQDSESMFGI